MNQDILVVGASGSIGHALVNQALLHLPAQARLVRMARQPQRLPSLNTPHQVIDLAMDFSDPAHIPELFEQAYQAWSQAAGLAQPAEHLAQVWLATGLLHDATMQPEKRYQSLNATAMQRAFAVNSIGPSLLLSQLIDRLPRRIALKIGVLSARVGSISDNRMGGWYSYRASKAALNMLLKTFAIELARTHPQLTLMGMQPGTTRSDLSAPFSRHVADSDLQSPEFTAAHLYQVLASCQPSDSGKLIDFMGEFFEP
ncbi:polysaccharide biosynthesis protein CapD [Thiomicrospira aerophila AL3]|uniref:Polysaccharide biosynthesis protein CapD n=1 Tax=Thiomicrospira aerophila AL3 TaxID=717772 RepID=W0DUS6_9GAMM|nr:SDR family NAD(P)-dependent oxidoreductase [Thiomicrospira aerophila]AHF00729.1 polysaccharide biosynthesis protein CapD [Thiomicrospira aerophila AL3]